MTYGFAAGKKTPNSRLALRKRIRIEGKHHTVQNRLAKQTKVHEEEG